MDTALLNGRVENNIQDLRESLSGKIRLSISGKKKKSGDQVTESVLSAHFNAMQRKGSMQGDNTIMAF